MPAFRPAITLAVLAAALVQSAPAWADAPTHIAFAVDGTFKSRFFSRACGFPVYEHQAGNVHITLFHDNAGAIVRELDTGPAFKTTWFSPVAAGGTGGSFASPNSASAKIDYPEGVFLGAPAFVVYHGLQVRAPGAAEAGYDAYAAEVGFIDEAGVPYIDILGPIDSRGSFTDDATFVSAVCAGLAAP